VARSLPSLAGQTVRRCRLRSGLSQAELAVLAGTTQSAISRLECGATTPPFDHVAELVRLMGLHLDLALEELGDDVTAIDRNLGLPFQDRWDQAVAAARFVLRGREALTDADVRPD
jgi:transcriptional regulator with XRE-family HTH domain